MTIKHTFVSPVADLGDPNEVGPDEWNQDHKIGDGTLQIDAAANVGTFTVGTLAALKLGTTTDGIGGNYGSTVNSGSTPFGMFEVKGTDSVGGGGPCILQFHDNTAPAINDYIGFHSFYGRDSAGATQVYAEIWTQIVSPTHLSASGTLNLAVTHSGTEITALTLGTTDVFGDYGHVLDVGSNNFGSLTVQSSYPGVGGVCLYLYQNSPSPAASDRVGIIDFVGKDTGNFVTEYAQIDALIVNATTLSEAARLRIRIANAGGWLEALNLGTTTFDGSFGHVFDFGTTNFPEFVLQNSSAADGGPVLIFYQNSASPAVNDLVGGMEFMGKDSAANPQSYGKIYTQITDPTSTSEDALMYFSLQSAGSYLQALTLGTTAVGGEPGHVFNVGSVAGTLEVVCSDATGFGAYLSLYNNSASPAANDEIGGIYFKGKNSLAAVKSYAHENIAILNATSGSEASSWSFAVLSAGTTLNALTLGTTEKTGIYGGYAHVFDVGSNIDGFLQLHSTGPDASGCNFSLFSDSPSPAASDSIGQILFHGRSSTNAATEYGAIQVIASNVTNGSQASNMAFWVQSAGVEFAALTLNAATSDGGSGSEFKLGSAAFAELCVSNTHTGSGGPGVILFANNSTPANNDNLGSFQWDGKTTLHATVEYGEINMTLVNAATGTTAMTFWINAGAALNPLSLGLAAGDSSGTHFAHKFDFGANGASRFSIVSSDPGATGPTLETYHNSASPAVSDYIASWTAMGNSSTAVLREYGGIYFKVLDPTNASEDAQIELYAQIAGTEVLATTIGAAGAAIKPMAGTATVAPVVFQSGTNLTNAVAGACEFDGAQFYKTIDTTSGRGAVPVEQYFHLTADGGTISTIANFFGATSNISLVASGYYVIDIYLYYLKTTAGTVTWTLTNSAAPTSQDIYYEMSPVTGIVAPPGTATMLVGQFSKDATAARTVVTGSLTTAVDHYAHFKIFLQNGTGTSLKIQATCSAGTITPRAGSFWSARRISPNNIGTFAA